jgi:cytochrome c553
MILVLLAALVPFPATAAELDGAAIYRQKCAICHGPEGQGTKRHKQPLEGDRSAAQLAELIGKTMPDDDPGSLSLPEARAVASYVYDTFYSPVARERNRPARIELARLTVPQYRNAVADLIGSFRPQPAWGDQRGLKGEYFAARRYQTDKRVLERVDPQVSFDFGTEPAVPGKMKPSEFYITWRGSLLAAQTGTYEFVVRTEHAAKLWVNDLKHPLIDAWVKSGKETEYQATLFLVAGRIYPLRLDFSKAKQGVDDSAKQKTPPPPVPASIGLWWKPPLGVREPIPSRQLAPNQAPESFICSTPFPPDDRSYGWERGTTVSKAWDQATTDAAIEAVGYVTSRLAELAGVPDDAKDRPQKLRAFCRTFGERAFRRPLTEEQAKRIDKQFDSSKDLDIAVKRALLLVLKSPRFLYREVGGEPGAYEVAARLSFGLWDSLPDSSLLEAAARGQLATTGQVKQQAQRMLTDPRARAKLHRFLMTWARANHGLDLAKDTKRFPDFDAGMIADLRTSLELFLDDVLWSPQSDFRDLLLANQVFLNSRLARFYGVNVPAGTDFTKVKLDDGRRAGVLTHPYLMTSFAHSSESSPIHRGVFLARGVLGVSLRPPPEAVVPLPPELHPNLTTRERVATQTQATACMRCHGLINPLGFTLEHFDAVGRFRDIDHGKPVDDAGSYRTRSGEVVTLHGARELATFLAGSQEAHAAFVEQLFHHLVQQPVRAYGPTTLDDLCSSFAANAFNIRTLAVEVMAVSALMPRPLEAHPKSQARHSSPSPPGDAK